MKRQNKDARFERPHTIYSIDDPETGEPLYIGQTVNLQRRIKEHLKLRPGKASTEFLEPLLAAGSEPVFTTIAVVPNRKTADAREVEEIIKAQAAGYDLFNHASEKNFVSKVEKAKHLRSDINVN